MLKVIGFLLFPPSLPWYACLSALGVPLYTQPPNLRGTSFPGGRDYSLIDNIQWNIIHSDTRGRKHSQSLTLRRHSFAHPQQAFSYLNDQPAELFSQRDAQVGWKWVTFFHRMHSLSILCNQPKGRHIPPSSVVLCTATLAYQANAEFKW